MNRVLLLLALLVLPSTAAAQVKPKIYIVFDTSGSMTDAAGDGSDLCAGKGKAGRIYQLKVAFMEVLQGLGAQEFDFALATFPMFLDPARTPICCADKLCNGDPPNSCSGHYYVTNAQDSNWDPGRNACKVSTHNISTQTTANCATSTCPWYSGYQAEVLKVPFSGTTPEKVMLYFDQKEDPGPVAGPVLTNPEVRSSEGWWTPLGKSLFYAHGYFHKDVLPTIIAYEKPCQRLAVALFTDGQETCDINASDTFYPTKWAANIYNNLGVTVHTVAIDTTSTLLSNIASSGHGGYYKVGGNTAALKQAFLDILAKSQPPMEICDGKDNDCDQLVDEDFPQKGQSCNNGKLGVCFRQGVYVCKSDGTGVVCNAPNANGSAEKCNGLDDDCDGAVDEDIPGGCIPPLCQPEICNGKDDDCDGLVDEDIPPGPCGKDVGVCKAGVTECVAGKLICKGGTLPGPEKCNNLDDDCDGVIDGIVETCYSYPTGCDLEQGTCKGICALGTQTCTAGKWGSCQGDVGPKPEVCDGVDNDCDGVLDNDAECPTGKCIEGQCALPCTSQEFNCPKGQLCVNNYCLKDPCDPALCEQQNPGWICKNGECIDACLNITCPPGLSCKKGVCQDLSCYGQGCPAGEHCVQGVCKPDPCAPVRCLPSEFCVEGKCLLLCDFVSCREGERCQVVEEGGSKQTRCVAETCGPCPTGKVCQAGKCVEDPCLQTFCPKGQVCVAGQCLADPCESVRCPLGFRCEQGNCLPTSFERSEVLATGGGGCACGIAEEAGGRGTFLLILLLGFLLMISRRRR